LDSSVRLFPVPSPTEEPGSADGARQHAGAE
jgi:hypothetical protein